jgi:hypothetical protein
MSSVEGGGAGELAALGAAATVGTPPPMSAVAAVAKADSAAIRMSKGKFMVVLLLGCLVGCNATALLRAILT